MKNTLTEEQMHHLSELFRAFAPEHMERWLYLIEHDPKRWGKISPMKIWPGDVYKSHPAHMDWQEMAHQYAAQYMNQDCVVFEGRYASVQTMKLRDLIHDSEIRLLEGFVSIVPGRLALATNHEGGSWLMKA